MANPAGTRVPWTEQGTGRRQSDPDDVRRGHLLAREIGESGCHRASKSAISLRPASPSGSKVGPTIETAGGRPAGASIARSTITSSSPEMWSRTNDAPSWTRLDRHPRAVTAASSWSRAAAMSTWSRSPKKPRSTVGRVVRPDARSAPPPASRNRRTRAARRTAVRPRPGIRSTGHATASSMTDCQASRASRGMTRSGQWSTRSAPSMKRRMSAGVPSRSTVS